MELETKTVNIKTPFFTKLEAIIAEACKRAKRLKLPQPEIISQRHYDVQVVCKGTKSVYIDHMVEVTIQSGVVQLDGWEFVASKDSKGLILGHNQRFDEIPKQYFENTNICEHCNSKRNRKMTCILYKKETGEWKEVGSTCMKDFTGHNVTQSLCDYMYWLENLSVSEIEEYGGRVEWCDSLKRVISKFAAAMDLLGYHKTDSLEECNQIPTKSFAGNVLLEGRFGIREKLRPVEKLACSNASEPEYIEFAEDCIKWFSEEFEPKTNFDYSMRAFFNTPIQHVIDSRGLGVLAYAVKTYFEWRFKPVEMKKPSEWVGTEGERLKKLELEIIESSVREELNEYAYDTWEDVTRIYMKDIVGNIFYIKTTSMKYLDENYNALPAGAKIVVSGTISFHGTRKNGDKYTMLKRPTRH